MSATIIPLHATATHSHSATWRITVALSVLLAFAGFEHGLFAALQGNRPTGGIGIDAIGPEMRWWAYGGESAVTLIPNFLLTGLAAMAVSALIVLWSLRGLHRRHGVAVLLGLFVLLTAVGGGVGFVPFYLVVCAYATRIGKPLAGWRRMLPAGARRRLAPLWPHALAGAAVCWLAAIAIAIFGHVPGLEDPEAVLAVCWTFLLLTLLLMNAAYVAGFADDLERGLAGSWKTAGGAEVRNRG